MIGRPVRINWRKEDTPETLKAAYLAQRDSILRTRLHGLWLVRSGWRLGEAARVVGVHERTVQTWVRWYREGGVEKVLAHKMGGRGQPRYLSVEQERELTEEVSTGRFRTAGEIRDWIEPSRSQLHVAFTPCRKVPRVRIALEKGGLCRALADAEVSSDTAFGFADEGGGWAWSEGGAAGAVGVPPVLGARRSEGEAGQVDRLDEV